MAGRNLGTVREWAFLFILDVVFFTFTLKNIRHSFISRTKFIGFTLLHLDILQTSFLGAFETRRTFD